MKSKFLINIIIKINKNISVTIIKIVNIIYTFNFGILLGQKYVEKEFQLNLKADKHQFYFY